MLLLLFLLFVVVIRKEPNCKSVVERGRRERESMNVHSEKASKRGRKGKIVSIEKGILLGDTEFLSSNHISSIPFFVIDFDSNRESRRALFS